MNMYPRKLGIFTPECSAMAFTMKLGPLPMYVIAPRTTAPRLLAVRCKASISPIFRRVVGTC